MVTISIKAARIALLCVRVEALQCAREGRFDLFAEAKAAADEIEAALAEPTPR